MTVIIPHPSEELKLVNLQKELISDLYIEGRILVAARPLWIPCNIENSADIKFVELGALETSDKMIYIPVTITSSKEQTISKLPLVNIHSDSSFSDKEAQLISQKKQPVKQLKIFRLGIEKELTSNSKCITESKWYKLS